MPRARLLRQRLLTLFLLGLLLLFSPLVLYLEGAGDWLGIPLLYVYLFAVWALIILLAAVIAAWHRD
ncbi:MAG: hypothetical protein EA400_09860 [Chromatiaceae bacterium]|nr:MAG: hypothetical protein EA400_09860 [Chromatiaceae bacterium]